MSCTPEHVTERGPFVVLPIGWPAADAEVPRIARKPLDEVLVRV